MSAEPRPQQIHLSSALAQRIVDELAPAIQENLNLMDAQGFIIASSDATRVGTMHPGAREAAATNVAVSVYAETVRSGERPGVNLPLEYRGTVIGVVGVTGTPEKVQSLAPVLVLTIALLFERESELAGESRRDAADRDVLARLVYGSRPLDAIGSLGQRAPALAGPWVLVAGMVPAAAVGGVPGAAVFDSARVARLRGALGPYVVVGALRGVLWVLASGVERATDGRSAAGSGAGAALAERVSALLPGAAVVYGSVCHSETKLAVEANQLAALSAQRTTWLKPGVRAASSHLLHLAAAQLPATLTESLVGLLQDLSAGERETLGAYLATGTAAELSRSGYTHRNTVRRHLLTVTERTGFDVRVPEQAAVLALALAAQRAAGETSARTR
ncbi:CdaR family transcriptional regulator [Leucobacter aridicollis]|uniref:CdaR family transcriptional regulator n=1 Tax=Leucobacter aridicollis TaxID=283878 RepID=UPI002104265C|nr:sugar diacid recognition domain-containing protein [Leucobacter aridicollis]UTX52828.1 helix-turn-helix domain-containing protein [Leucobacter aridicollis]